MATEDRPPVKAEQGQAQRPYQDLSVRMKVMLVAPPVVVSCALLIFNYGWKDAGDYEWLLFWCGVSLPLFMNLVIPSKNYDRGVGRAFGFAVSAFTVGMSIPLAVLVVCGVVEGISKMNDPEVLLLIGAPFIMGAIAVLVASTVVSLKKLQPKAGQIAAIMAVGMGVGSLASWLVLRSFD